MRPLYIAATGQHIGKTTSTLGLVTNIKEQGFNVGYCKPVGQSHLTIRGQVVDKDVTLFAQMLKFDIEAHIHSPVVMAKGVTKKYIEHPEQYNLKKNILDAAEILAARHQITVFEGTGHPGVGSVADVSNADVAKLLNAGVVMVAEGGIGKTIDKLTLSIGQFKHYNIPILGVIVNKVLPEKLDQVNYYVGKRLNQMDLELLGVIPFDKRLSFPIMETIKRAIRGRVLFNEDKLDRRVEDIVAGSLVDVKEFSSFRNILLVVSHKRMEEALEKVKSIAKIKKLEGSPLSGIIITGDGRDAHHFTPSEISNTYIQQNNIPVITTELDTYGSVVKISRIEVKINTRTPWKTQRAIELIRENVQVDRILNKLELLKVH